MKLIFLETSTTIMHKALDCDSQIFRLQNTLQGINHLKYYDVENSA